MVCESYGLSRHHLTVITLQVAMRFVGNYVLHGLSPQTDGMPVIHINRVDANQPYFFISISLIIRPSIDLKKSISVLSWVTIIPVFPTRL